MELSVNFSGSFLGYMKAYFPEINLAKLVFDVKDAVLSDFLKRKVDFDGYKASIGDRYFDYEHALKIKIFNDNNEFKRVVDIPTLVKNYKEAVKTLSDVSKDVV